MERIKELNRKNSHILQPYRRLELSKPKIINNSLGYFLLIGVALLGAGLVLDVPQTVTGTDPVITNALLSFIMSLISIFVMIVAISWTINVGRSVLEKIANKDIKLTESSFAPEFDEKFFKRGLKYIASTLILGFVGGLVLSIVITAILAVIIGGAVTGFTVLTETLFGGFVGFFLGIIIAFIAVLTLTAFINPFFLPMNSLYVFYGDDIGVIEAVTLTLKLGAKNYGKLLGVTFKTYGLSLLGLLFFGVGIVYTGVWAMLIELDAMGEILGVSLKEGHTFKHGDIREIPQSNNPTEETVEEEVEVEEFEGVEEVIYPEDEEELIVDTPEEVIYSTSDFSKDTGSDEVYEGEFKEVDVEETDEEL